MLKQIDQKEKVQVLRCLHCMKVIRCSRFDTGALLHHIEQKHPDLIALASSTARNIYKHTSDRNSGESLSHIKNQSTPSPTELKTADLDQCKNKREISCDNTAKKPLTTKCNVAATNGQCRGSKEKITTCPKHKINKPCPHKNLEAFRKMSYKSSVRRWYAVEGSIFCPCCGYKKRPLIKCASDLNSGWCSWPFCFLPCLMSSDNREYLYCSHCNTFLGVYDREKNSVSPNKEYV